ncbi:hypothetical protein F5Y19DRAFT_472362 [Xylariaceae sp. FL1651]|nr:hypothetical protein F5Y19DRAFT_472362 [Xylariaceae sp. FL1651]
MEQPLICSSLRKRPDWAVLPLALLRSDNTCGNWREARLDTHDVAIPLTKLVASPQRVFRAVFLSPRDVGSARSSSRIERLYNLTSGRDVGIIFLLKHDVDQPSPVATLMTLQLQLIGSWDMPIIPVESVAAMSMSLMILHDQLVSAAAHQNASGSVTSLLPFCSERQLLTEHTVNILTDITSGFRDLLGKLSPCARFELEIVQFLGEDAEKLQDFWKDEYLVD